MRPGHPGTDPEACPRGPGLQCQGGSESGRRAVDVREDGHHGEIPYATRPPAKDGLEMQQHGKIASFMLHLRKEGRCGNDNALGIRLQGQFH